MRKILVTAVMLLTTASHPSAPSPVTPTHPVMTVTGVDRAGCDQMGGRFQDPGTCIDVDY